jgi:hypothetical protein
MLVYAIIISSENMIFAINPSTLEWKVIVTVSAFSEDFSQFQIINQH